MDAHTAMLIVAASERDANLYYATGFLAPDSFVFIQTATQKILLMSDLEIDRAKQQSTVDVVLSFSAYDQKAQGPGDDRTPRRPMSSRPFWMSSA